MIEKWVQETMKAQAGRHRKSVQLARTLLMSGLVAAVVSSCGGISADQVNSHSGANEDAVASRDLGASDAGVLEHATDQFARGEAVFTQYCTTCHSVQPPPNKAPPMMMVSQHYHDAFDSRDEAIAAIVSWIRSPSSDKSILPAMAIERFGLMAPLALPDTTLESVATWIWDMYDESAATHGRRGMGRMGRRGGP